MGFLLRILLILAVLYALWRLLYGVLEGAGITRVHDGTKAGGKLVRDPVCGIFISPRQALTARAGGETAYFCSEKCRREWEQR